MVEVRIDVGVVICVLGVFLVRLELKVLVHGNNINGHPSFQSELRCVLVLLLKVVSFYVSIACGAKRPRSL